jgi:hypothetical protein
MRRAQHEARIVLMAPPADIACLREHTIEGPRGALRLRICVSHATGVSALVVRPRFTRGHVPAVVLLFRSITGCPPSTNSGPLSPSTTMRVGSRAELNGINGVVAGPR